jgi:3-deoxy-D-manno-octulosonate 8-phosphate phosphatase (KDO 8-P phosphatase)
LSGCVAPEAASRGGRRSATRPSIEVRARRVRVVAVDLDGALTDGRFLLDARGRATRMFHAADRIAIAMLGRAGIAVVALAARPPRARPAWARALGVAAVLDADGQSLDAVRRYCARRHVGLDAVAYVGSDVLELPLAEAVGLVISVADGAHQMKQASQWVVGTVGGSGVLREVGERLLRAQGKWASTIGEIWRRWD